MAERRPDIPRPLARQVKIEAGHRCAIPTCRQTPVELHHIVPWATVNEHAFENLIALCPTDHARAERGDIDRQSLLAYKQNLAVLNSRYGDMERRLLDLFAHNPVASTAVFEQDMTFPFMYLLRDGLLTGSRHDPGVSVGGRPIGSIFEYKLTQAGESFVDRWGAGQPLAEE